VSQILLQEPVLYYPETGEVERANPVPSRAARERAGAQKEELVPGKAAKAAAEYCGVGRIKWSKVQDYLREPKEIAAFLAKYQIKSYLRSNAKTDKPRPSGRIGKIAGLSLAPHFYPNMLAVMPFKKDGTLATFPKEQFNAFDGSGKKTASMSTGVPQDQLLDFCFGSSPFCRQTCLVLSGQNPSTNEAPRSKMKNTLAFLENPELFVAGLHKELQAKGNAARRGGYDLVVRLNMLSDLPWYVMCPELLEENADLIAFYDYTKVPYWGDPAYERVRELLDLTFSFSGTNAALTEQALKSGERIAACFAPADPERAATIPYRTSWQEIIASGMVTKSRGKHFIKLLGGEWEIVDGDLSDYRVDDPQPSIVALNFKQPNIKEETVKGITEKTRQSRAKFAYDVPDVEGRGASYVHAKARLKKTKLPDLEKLPLSDVIALGEQLEARKRGLARFNPLPILPEGSGEAEEALVPLTMFPIVDSKGFSDLLIGPHVPTVEND
jgi:hypothetical protein